jgi:hypothetical protein
MAENKEIVVKLTVDTKGTESGLESVKSDLKGVEDEIKKVNDTPLTLDEQLKKITKEVNAGGLSMRELTGKIKEYQTIALQAGRESPIGRQAIQQAASLQDELGDLRNEVKRLSADGQKMQGALALGSAVAGGYGALQGVMALAGQENEALMQSLVKMQAAQSALAGIEQLRLSLEKESVLMLNLKNVQTKIATGLTLAYSAVVGTTTGGLKLLRLALISTGIGAIIVGLGLLIANFDKVTMAVKWCYNQVIELWHGFQELGTGVKILLSIMFPFVGVIWAVTEALQAMGVVETVEQRKTREAIEAKMKVATEAHNKRVAEIKEQIKQVKLQQEAEKAATDLAIKNIDREIELRRAAGESVKELEESKLNILIQSARQQYNLAKTLMELQDAELFARREHNIELQKIQGKNTEQLQKALDFEKRQRALIIAENLAAEKDALDQALHNLKVFQISAETERRNAQKKETKEDDEQQKKEEKARLEEAKRIAAQLEKERLLKEDYRLRNLEAEELALEKRKSQLDKELELAGNNLELQKLLKEEYESEVLAIEEKFAEQRDKLAEQEKEKQARLDKEELDRKLANYDAVDARLEQGATFLSDLNAVFSKNSEKEAKREFQINKARDLAGAVTNTAKGVTQALASAPPPISFVNAGIVGALGAANIARIAKTKFGSASSGGGGGVSIPRVSSGGANGGTGGQSQQNDNLTNIAQLLNQQPRPVLVVDSFNKVDREAEKIRSVSSI